MDNHPSPDVCPCNRIYLVDLEELDYYSEAERVVRRCKSMNEHDGFLLEGQSPRHRESKFVRITSVCALTFEVKISVWRNHATSTACAIAIVARNVKHGLLSFRHRHHALIPSFYNLADANGKREWPSTVAACVEL